MLISMGRFEGLYGRIYDLHLRRTGGARVICFFDFPIKTRHMAEIGGWEAGPPHPNHTPPPATAVTNTQVSFYGVEAVRKSFFRRSQKRKCPDYPPGPIPPTAPHPPPDRASGEIFIIRIDAPSGRIGIGHYLFPQRPIGGTGPPSRRIGLISRSK